MVKAHSPAVQQHDHVLVVFCAGIAEHLGVDTLKMTRPPLCWPSSLEVRPCWLPTWHPSCAPGCRATEFDLPSQCKFGPVTVGGG